MKGVAATIPNQRILIGALGFQEAKDSSTIENVVTTHDELFKNELLSEDGGSAATREVRRYRQALSLGFRRVVETGLLTINHMLEIQAELIENDAGFRKLPGTKLVGGSGQTVYVLPQDHATIALAMTDLEQFINDDTLYDVDPLIKMALIHRQFEAIHPFYDGNGRTGRIVNVLYLVKQRLLDVPVVYLSREIVRTKGEYYRLLRAVDTNDAWEDWVLYMLRVIEITAAETIETIRGIHAALLDYKHRIRAAFKFYSQDLINNLFTHPYTKIEFVERDLKVSRLTATKYLNELTKAGFLEKKKFGRTNYFVNLALLEVLTAPALRDDSIRT